MAKPPPIPEKNTTKDTPPKENLTKEVTVSSVMVFVELSDGTIRNAAVASEELSKSILHICTMNDKKGLLLGTIDLKPALKELLEVKKND